MSEPKYRSKFEQRVAADFAKRGVDVEYESTSFAYLVTRKYKPDFKPKKPAVRWILEVKGYFTPGDRAKTLAVLAQHPGLDLRFCFQNSKNRLSKESKTTYGDWCNKHGIRFCDGRVPDAWLDE